MIDDGDDESPSGSAASSQEIARSMAVGGVWGFTVVLGVEGVHGGVVLHLRVTPTG